MKRFLTARNTTRGTVLATRVEIGSALVGGFLGLMGRAGLEPGSGLWLRSNGIHMMFMRFSIDAVFLGRLEPGRPDVGRPDTGRPDSAGSREVLSVHRALPTWRGLVPFIRGADGVLELPIGVIDDSGTAVGDRVVLERSGG